MQGRVSAADPAFHRPDGRRRDLGGIGKRELAQEACFSAHDHLTSVAGILGASGSFMSGSLDLVLVCGVVKIFALMLYRPQITVSCYGKDNSRRIASHGLPYHE
ncbi:hypothetical protein LJR219_003990 [Phenylobacterium sp. LjRoot219]|uniref:hypothetical protein n=1 Tax=Phenylobacterium sp. LjRoot219 TaxID=3342283 RepID=UPI003ED11EA5